MTPVSHNLVSHPSETQQPLYNRDFYAWTQEMVNALRSGNWAELDIENLVEELESLGRRERQELGNWLAVLLGHLLKWQYQPANRSNSWRATLREQRRRIGKLLKENPSLQPYVLEAMAEAYEIGRDLAIQETNLPDATFPEIGPYELTQVIDLDFLPE
ncbi:DUF29 domain-containing protein [Alkalinema sp. FACHB-956]|uniref:DUF29 domain-containing protein n=1 Tax=Alkalinema sp. FACHB-956 TaxID=2692768 RepID=UPI0016857A15|nr:DUF29 domain-containing protein [Alkalinema sp. FACHB-956]MBD2327512.1 DUF29 domain-containing protein [Alkalinema sp. FACHB-956]